jgi:transcriptional regulator with XRE-family HTH domain
MPVVKEILVSDLVVAIEERIEELGLTDNKSAAARAIGVSRQRLDGWLRGGNPEMNARTQMMLARFLRVPPREVLELAGLDLSSAIARGYRGLAA